MINGRLWTIVNPTVGVPLFFIGVVVTSLFIHLNLMNRTSYFQNFWQGAEAQQVAAEADGDKK